MRGISIEHWKFFSNIQCEYFPCHKINNNQIENFNCKWCYCALYPYHDCGGNYTMLNQQIKDCTDCLIPHLNHDYVLNKLKEKLWT